MLWLDPRKTFARKFDELLITIHLERKLSKQQIFEYYVNQVPLGRRGSFAIRGFGEAAQAYFGKGSRRSFPYLKRQHWQASFSSQVSEIPCGGRSGRSLRRNVVLRQMLDNGYISQPQFEEASAAAMVA